MRSWSGLVRGGSLLVFTERIDVSTAEKLAAVASVVEDDLACS
ncbi:hypothetical protein ABZW96_36055 [Nocardia sp. NPDC004168]